MATKLNITSISLLLLLACVTEVQSNVFDVRKYGAKSDGKTDICQALVSAWKGACASVSRSKVVIPGGTYALGQVTLAGPCKAPIEVQVIGTLKASTDPKKFTGDAWVSFYRIDKFTLSGGGTFDGQGATAWTQNNFAKSGKWHAIPINIRFDYLTNSTIRDITSRDSKLFHVNVLGCTNVTFQSVKIIAPGTSPNTDGIHVGRSTGITITDSKIQTGDDCVSIGDGSQQIYVTKVACGPGHGFSVGSLGKYSNEEPVVGVYVRNCTLTNTMNGVRVKTWPASPAGVASDLHFEDIIMNNVGNPILIDQEYCPSNHCTKKLPSRVMISNVSFKRIRGTSSTQLAVKLVCSKSLPCKHVEIADINLTYNGKEGHAVSQCANIKPMLSGRQTPPTCA